MENETPTVFALINEEGKIVSDYYDTLRGIKMGIRSFWGVTEGYKVAEFELVQKKIFDVEPDPDRRSAHRTIYRIKPEEQTEREPIEGISFNARST